MSNAEIRFYRELCRLLGAIPHYQIPDDLTDAELSLVDHSSVDVRDATELMRTLPSELRAYLCMPYERLLEIFRLVNECQRQAERTVTKMMEVGDTLDIETDSPKLEELAFKLTDGRTSANDPGVIRRIVRPPTVVARERLDIGTAPTIVLDPGYRGVETPLPDLPSPGDTLPLPANDSESVEIDVVEATDDQTNQERILDALARLSANMHRPEESTTQALPQTSRWEERYQQKRLASYCFAGVVTGVILAFGLAVAHEKLTEPTYATEIEVHAGDGQVHGIGFTAPHMMIESAKLHPTDKGSSLRVFSDQMKTEYLYTIEIKKEKL